MRPTCPRCLRPSAFCLCLPGEPLQARTRVVILQHPREARLAICSAFMTRLALASAELHRGVRFGDHPRVREVAAEPGAALLYPGPGATPAAAAAAAPPPALLVIDGTWLQAERMLRDNPFLAALPRLAVQPDLPSGYGELRREPGPEHLPTIEAVAQALGALEGDPARFEPMRTRFREVVERQLSCARGPRRSPRHRPASR
ncbi:MAG: DTW domain-containing protein [Deltaproteobacteria bacterium]|nr:DTW domain-containing protein [Deltaproteobacteria bacterium]